MSNLRAAKSMVLAAPLTLSSPSPAQQTQHLAGLVDLRIGVLGNGDGGTVIGPTLPHGSIHPSPDTPQGGQAGYRVDRPIRSFSQLHSSGTGWGRYGNLMLSPQLGLNTAPDGHDSEKSNETATPYSYKVRLARYNILVELTPTHHAALDRVTYPPGGQSYLTLDLSRQIPGQLGTKPGDGKVDASTITLNPRDGSFSGFSRYTGGWGRGSYTVYATLNGRTLDRAWLRHREIASDTTLVFTMSPTPTAWGTANPPPSGQALLDAVQRN